MSKFKKFPEWKGIHQGYGQHQYLQSVEAWKRDTIKKLEKAQKELNEILDSELMKMVGKFAKGEQARGRWEGMLAVVEELLGVLKP